uniref:Lipoprotein n=1 Tax=Strongyloides papillosus TaxID=174720 RepID=A0A0N5BE78_STREA
MKFSSRIVLFTMLVAIIMVCLVTHGNAEGNNGDEKDKQNNTSPDTPTAKAAAGLSYSGSNSIILSGLCALSIILGAKL